MPSATVEADVPGRRGAAQDFDDALVAGISAPLGH
jgi:hypothetical protein